MNSKVFFISENELTLINGGAFPFILCVSIGCFVGATVGSVTVMGVKKMAEKFG